MSSGEDDDIRERLRAVEARLQDVEDREAIKT